MPPRENVEIAKRYLACLSAGAGPEEVASFFAPEVIQEEFPNRLMPHGATRNLDALKEDRARGLALLQGEVFELVNALASDEQVAMEVVWRATVRQGLGPFVVGQQLRARFALFIELRDGRIVRQRNYDCFDSW